MGHAGILFFVCKQFPDKGINGFFPCASQLQGASRNALRALGGVPQDDNRLAQGGGFLLDDAAVRQD